MKQTPGNQRYGSRSIQSGKGKEITHGGISLEGSAAGGGLFSNSAVAAALRKRI